ncbi:hypothetical protein PFDSM3638_07895 [Pyrococcus furiosus DSM 3638]|uniref:Uncharacterized protein n=3 Tax=Pyrococcus furiosus TaxID=2261 RepID=Q8U0M1_PYRFU|nr:MULTISPECIES: hypothetical protein [Pyrococcus]AAL81690.1 hypothetical protein PF1566 [Pyrococcus furiosus DSM 3638]AFN04348.1 hypothetical protein PFC_07060 [Pyrococcus furiosus COM1]MDK2868987.1 hypothetical protein [Pyrococcus sp.]QEK79189.1 hypothetical protein PFDSM3638_07895 [Pyrococcus furiosus DSM 3638]
MYFDHFPTFGGYIFSMVLYYTLIPAVLLVTLRIKWNYIVRRYWRSVLKAFIIAIFISSLITSLLQFKLTNDYLYVYSLTRTGVCLTSSCLISEMERNRDYHFNITAIKSYGMPRAGLMMAFRLVDRKYNPSKGRFESVNSVVIIRSLAPIPAVEVWDYKVDPKDSHRIIGLRKFYIYYPYSPATFLTKAYDFEFTMFLWGMRGGAA